MPGKPLSQLNYKPSPRRGASTRVDETALELVPSSSIKVMRVKAAEILSLKQCVLYYVKHISVPKGMDCPPSDPHPAFAPAMPM